MNTSSWIKACSKDSSTPPHRNMPPRLSLSPPNPTHHRSRLQRRSRLSKETPDCVFRQSLNKRKKKKNDISNVQTNGHPSTSMKHPTTNHQPPTIPAGHQSCGRHFNQPAATRPHVTAGDRSQEEQSYLHIIPQSRGAGDGRLLCCRRHMSQFIHNVANWNRAIIPHSRGGRW
jgi:hypothetical protein